MIYYTFRLHSLSPVRLECCKWDDCSSNPIAIHTVYPNQSDCNCYSYSRDCKHVVLARAIIKPEFVSEMHLLRWDEKNSWVWLEDMTPMEEILEAVGG